MEDIGLFFRYENQIIQIPVNPEKLTISYGTNNKTLEIIQLREINILKKRQLATIKFESWFPYESWWTGVRTKGEFKSAEFYKDFFKRLLEESKPCWFIVTGINYNSLVSIESFDYYNQGGDYEDCYYTLQLKEYVPYHVEILEKVTTADTQTESVFVSSNKDKPVLQPEQITIGCSVILNGTLHRDSYGNGPGQTRSNFKGKVNFIKKENPYPYHITTEDGGWLGWVKASDVKLA